MNVIMDELKTLKDLQEPFMCLCCRKEFKKLAIININMLKKEMIDNKLFIPKYKEYLYNQIILIKILFNITEKDLK